MWSVRLKHQVKHWLFFIEGDICETLHVCLYIQKSVCIMNNGVRLHTLETNA